MVLGAAALAFALHAQVAGAWSSARPRECLPATGARDVNVWERAKAPELRRFCDLLASGAAKMAASVGMSEEVLAIAGEAERLRPGRAATSVLRGRALAQRGRDEEAKAAFVEAQARDANALDDPAGLLAWARTLARTGQPAPALAAYRALLPRAAALPSPERGAAAVEAGMLAMGGGKAGLEDAIALFRQARRDAQDSMTTVAGLGLALALDRAGEREEARAVAFEVARGDVRATLATVERRVFVGGQAPEASAFAALALERSDLPAAQRAWRAYAEAAGPRSPWFEHARAHAEARAPGSRRRDEGTP